MTIAAAIAKGLVKGLAGMFIADAGLAAAILVHVALVFGLAAGLRIEPLLAGAILLFGCLAILVAAVGRTAGGQPSR